MAKLFTDGNKHNELADEVINASTKALSYFFEECQEAIRTKDISAVELYLFYLCQTWFLLKSHILEMGADQNDQMVLFGTIIHKFCNRAASLTFSKNLAAENNNLDFWGQELKKNLIFYQQIANEGGVAELMQVAYNKIIKSDDQDFQSATGKAFLASAYIASVHIEEKLEELM
ncbi:MAG: hypothetical protein WCX77_01180 [Candidatus Paceibacterota bacterium]|jgi:hypothetical protein